MKSNGVKSGDLRGQISLVINLLEKKCYEYSFIARVVWAVAAFC